LPENTAMTQPSTISIAALETVYDTLAQAIDKAGADKTELFLVKLALLNANARGSERVFQEHIDAALRDL
jgi:hypothetical protein